VKRRDWSLSDGTKEVLTIAAIGAVFVVVCGTVAVIVSMMITVRCGP